VIFQNYLMKKYSISVFQAGRFGNQLFQLAAAVTLVEKLKSDLDPPRSSRIYWYGDSPEIDKICTVLKVPIEFRRNRIIERLISGPTLLSNRSLITRTLYSLWWRFQKIGKELINSSDEILNKKKSSSKKFLLSGYFHDFSLASTLIGKSENIESLNTFLSDRLKSQFPSLNSNFIGVHLRNGDYLLPANRKALGELNEQYYKKAINLLSPNSAKTPIMIFSDDTVAAALKLSKQTNLDVELAENYCENLFEEFVLLALMNKKILSNSTFSWWAGYFSQDDSQIVAPDPLSLEQIQGRAMSPRFIYLKNEY
jgi:hypothetical protein